MKSIQARLIVFTVFMILPLLSVSFIGFLEVDFMKLFSVLLNTFLLAILSVGISFIFAIPSAYIFTCKKTKFIIVINLLIAITPPFLLSILLSNLFFTLDIANGFFALSLAHMISIYPYSLVFMILGFTLVPQNAKYSASLYATNLIRGFLLYYFPFMRTSFIIATILGISISMSQYILTFMLTKPSFSTLILDMIPYLKSVDIQSASTYGTVFIINTLLASYILFRFKNVISQN